MPSHFFEVGMSNQPVFKQVKHSLHCSANAAALCSSPKQARVVVALHPKSNVQCLMSSKNWKTSVMSPKSQDVPKHPSKWHQLQIVRAPWSNTKKSLFPELNLHPAPRQTEPNQKLLEAPQPAMKHGSRFIKPCQTNGLSWLMAVYNRNRSLSMFTFLLVLFVFICYLSHLALLELLNLPSPWLRCTSRKSSLTRSIWFYLQALTKGRFGSNICMLEAK